MGSPFTLLGGFLGGKKKKNNPQNVGSAGSESSSSGGSSWLGGLGETPPPSPGFPPLGVGRVFSLIKFLPPALEEPAHGVASPAHGRVVLVEGLAVVEHQKGVGCKLG